MSFLTNNIRKRNFEEDAAFKEASKRKLKKEIEKKIQTTMIGALDSIEKKFGFLWEEESELYNIYQELRKEILDKGNKQIRDVGKELERYDVEWLKYSINLPLKRKERDGKNE